MNGIDLMNNLIDELNRAKEFARIVAEGNADYDNLPIDMCDELLNDIETDLERYYDYADSINTLLEDLEIE